MSDEQFRREVQDVKLMHLFATRAALDMHGREWIDSEKSIAKQALTSAFGGCTLNSNS